MTSSDPLAQVAAWLAEARRHEAINPDAACLATAAADGRPSARMVLVKGADRRGLIFYTNTESRKAAELRENPQAALCLYWRTLGRQLRVEGAVEPVPDAEADAYFATRERGSQIGAWASAQSCALTSRAALEARFAEHEARFADRAVPRPPFWSGYLVRPRRIEFWTQGVDRLHDRIAFTGDPDGGWTETRLYP